MAKGRWSLSATGRPSLDVGMTSEPVSPRNRLHRLGVPATVVGRWSLALFGLGVVGFMAMVAVVGLGQTGGDTFTDNWWISGPALVAALGIVGAFATGLYAILRQRERAALVILATVIGGLVTFFIIGEVSTPH